MKVRLLPNPPNWRDRITMPDTALVALPLVGTNPTLKQRTQTFSAIAQKAFVGERLVVSKIGKGRLSAQLYIGSELQNAEGGGFDPEIVGSPSAFGVRLRLKGAEPGTMIRMVITWEPAFSCRMSIEEYERRANKAQWSSKVRVLGKWYSLRIPPEKVRLELVDLATYRRIKREGLVRDFNPFLDVKVLLLGRIVH